MGEAESIEIRIVFKALIMACFDQLGCNLAKRRLTRPFAGGLILADGVVYFHFGKMGIYTTINVQKRKQFLVFYEKSAMTANQ